MSVRSITSNLFKLAILGVCVFAFTKWQAAESQDGSLKAFTENACLDEIRNRYNVSRVKAYDFRETSSGYTVRASATSATGAPVKIVCLANTHGGIRDLAIDER